MESFSLWLENELKMNGYDADVCTGYLMSLLESQEEIHEWLQEMSDQLDESGIQQFHDQIYEYYLHPERIPQKKEEIYDSKDSDPPVGGEKDEKSELSQEATTPSPESEMINETRIEFDNLTMTMDDENEDEEDLTQEMEDEMIDFVSLAQDLEWYLSNADPLVIFSTDAIMESLYYTNGSLPDAFNLLQMNYQLCGFSSSTPQSRPCRHLIQSGKCLRSDCIFDHSFASKTCKFWLTTGCLSGECLFLHQLIFPEYSTAASSGPFTQPPPPAAADMSTTSIFDFPELISQTKKLQSDVATKATSLSSSSSSVSYKSALQTTVTETDPDHEILLARKQQRGVGSISSASISQNLWVESGESVCSNYKEQREDARTLAIARNKLLEEATQAYLRSPIFFFLSTDSSQRSKGYRQETCERRSRAQ
jgi:hypothetical protein